ncbi:MAG: hypothetical protein Fur0043_11600 [Anaerolineales bacterium]
MMKRRLCLAWTLLLLTACTFPGLRASWTTPGPAPVSPGISPPTTSPVPLVRPTPTSAPLGTQENPLVLALLPALTPEGTRVEAGKAFAAQLAEETGYTFVVVVPETYAKLVEALGRGNAHIAVLSPYAYALAYEKGYVTAAFASLKEGKKAYGAQFIARVDAGFTSYYDARAQANTADAAAALSQFRDKKPCWSDATSPSGYIIPAGILAYHGIVTRPAAFVQGQPTVARAVYVGGICDFGATYIDAREFPALRDAFPDILEQVNVIWQVPPILPYEALVLASNLPPEMAASLQTALFRLTGMKAGRQDLVGAYGIENWETVNDTFYADFLLYLETAPVEIETLLEELP